MTDSEKALIEAVLFLEGDPIDIASIAKITGLSADRVGEGLECLRRRCAAPDCGVELIGLGGGYLLTPKESLWEGLKERYGKKNDHRLSRAAIETLSIIAYRQPITRAEIENIRGVNADTMIRLLLSKNLIAEKGKKEVPGHPILYGTTREFLRSFSIASIADLPKLDEVNRERFELR